MVSLRNGIGRNRRKYWRAVRGTAHCGQCGGAVLRSAMLTALPMALLPAVVQAVSAALVSPRPAKRPQDSRVAAVACLRAGWVLLQQQPQQSGLGAGWQQHHLCWQCRPERAAMAAAAACCACSACVESMHPPKPQETAAAHVWRPACPQACNWRCRHPPGWLAFWQPFPQPLHHPPFAAAACAPAAAGRGALLLILDNPPAFLRCCCLCSLPLPQCVGI